MERKLLLISALLLLFGGALTFVQQPPATEAQNIINVVKPHSLRFNIITDVLTWGHVRNAAGYRVRWKGDNSQHWNYKNFKANVRRMRFYNLFGGVTYTIQVQALSSKGERFHTDYSEALTFTEPYPPPTATPTATATNTPVPLRPLAAPEWWPVKGKTVAWSPVEGANRYHLVWIGNGEKKQDSAGQSAGVHVWSAGAGGGV